MQYVDAVSTFIPWNDIRISFGTLHVAFPKQRSNKTFSIGVQPPDGSYLCDKRDIMDCVMETFLFSVILYMDEEFMSYWATF